MEGGGAPCLLVYVPPGRAAPQAGALLFTTRPFARPEAVNASSSVGVFNCRFRPVLHTAAVLPGRLEPRCGGRFEFCFFFFLSNEGEVVEEVKPRP